ncbi:hypothetical protein CCAX7_56080 [Capsulimonas corticalis]|uniref:Uncharacterized protein n=1 Tax=Capsulimonas corticalis TaxID=2219043 RepID=A0A402D0Q1_9BACT|nr:hypothetical protein [Capsulimonas corticalis]BDI33557.1 hypothetical protein CCAX7_56080 [Capsulimonas corticalis]
MSEFQITKTDDRLTLRRTRESILSRCVSVPLLIAWSVWLYHRDPKGNKIQPFPHTLDGAASAVMMAAVMGFLLYVFYQVMVARWLIVLDRKNDALFIDGRKICGLNDVRAEIERSPLPWTPVFFIRQLLVLHVPRRKIQIRWARGFRREAEELQILSAAIAEMLPRDGAHRRRD